MSQALEEAIGYRFRRQELLRSALTHKSFASEQKSRHCNERLEFLGDSILSAVVAHRLFESYPDEEEGSLSKRKSGLVSRTSLARWGQDLSLGDHLFLGAGEAQSGGRLRPSILCNAIEALIGAMYIDGGYDAASAFIDGWLTGQTPGPGEADFKSRLQEILQKRYKVPPHYEVQQAFGPDHDKTFSVTVRLGKNVLGSGKGKSKKEAEQAAAKDALGRQDGPRASD
ncbi:MAG: ribonuclease III [Elusimicrobia bacterium]|nr:ribonuclease III [Elusimicrobiota bacterium]